MISGPKRKFCERIVAGDNATIAYLTAYPKSGKEAARKNAPRLMSNDDIEAEIQALRDRADSLAGSAVLSLAEKRKFLARIVRMQGGFKVDDDLVNGVRVKEFGQEMILPCKLKALELDAKLAGEFDEDRSKAKEADALQSLMMQIAGGVNASDQLPPK